MSESLLLCHSGGKLLANRRIKSEEVIIQNYIILQVARPKCCIAGGMANLGDDIFLITQKCCRITARDSNIGTGYEHVVLYKVKEQVHISYMYWRYK
jgi:hypothetical protein